MQPHGAQADLGRVAGTCGSEERRPAWRPPGGSERRSKELRCRARAWAVFDYGNPERPPIGAAVPSSPSEVEEAIVERTR